MSDGANGIGAGSENDGGTEPGSEGGTQPASEEGATGDEDADGSSPEDAFEVLGHDIRLRVVEALAARRRNNWQWVGERFATLRKEVGVRDAGKFSYHLDRLRPTFVVKDGAEYKLTFAGMQVAGTVAAGTYEASDERREGPAGVECQACGEPLRARYEYQYCWLVCENHGHLYGNTLPPGAAADRSMAELVALADREASRDVQRAREGVCPHCWGPTRTSLPAADVMPDPETGESPDEWDALGEWAAEATFAQFSCERSGLQFWVPPGSCVVDHPVVVEFCYEHGLEVRETPMAGLAFTYSDAATLASTDPVRVRVDVEMDDEELAVWLDDDAEVVDTERVRGTP